MFCRLALAEYGARAAILSKTGLSERDSLNILQLNKKYCFPALDRRRYFQ